MRRRHFDVPEEFQPTAQQDHHSRSDGQNLRRPLANSIARWRTLPNGAKDLFAVSFRSGLRGVSPSAPLVPYSPPDVVHEACT